MQIPRTHPKPTELEALRYMCIVRWGAGGEGAESAQKSDFFLDFPVDC